MNNKVTINGWTIDKYSGNLMVEVLLNSLEKGYLEGDKSIIKKKLLLK
ncbi:hypothetical protein SAM46_03185 [Mycoplasmopsis verecunda]|nr:hypothetical protein [Mycoplasmopsis verecunda]WPB54463.1 hypothetical protein SAM46_03185 [Mycoplasmopsis verecunda]